MSSNVVEKEYGSSLLSNSVTMSCDETPSVRQNKIILMKRLAAMVDAAQGVGRSVALHTLVRDGGSQQWKGTDALGPFQALAQRWKAGNRSFATSARVYENAIVFEQEFVDASWSVVRRAPILGKARNIQEG